MRWPVVQYPHHTFMFCERGSELVRRGFVDSTRLSGKSSRQRVNRDAHEDLTSAAEVGARALNRD